MSEIRFGTDGWRAVIAEDFTFDNVDRVAQATAAYWKGRRIANTLKHVVVGYDRRFFSDRFARRTAEILAGNGFKVLLSDAPCSTPSVSFAVHKGQCRGGVMITASHNPPAFNGFKLKAHYGGSASPDICQGVEAMLDGEPVKAMEYEDAVRSGAIRVQSLSKSYYAALKKLVDFKLIAASGLRFAHEALFGTGAGAFDEILEGTTCRVTTLNGGHDPNFGGINPEPIPKNYRLSAAYLKRHPHDLCLVTDGDADRIGGMDGHGNALSTHQLICLLLKHYVENKGMKGRVVKALTVTSMIEKMAERYGLPVVETGVGFKYICHEMLKGGVLLGAEESGGIGFPGHIPERDGILAGLMLLEMLAVTRKTLNQLLKELEKEYGPHHYARLDAHYPLEKRDELMACSRDHPPARLLKSPLKSVKSFDGVKYIAEDGSWLMLRGSGTEPVLRIYAEAKSETEANNLLRKGVQMTKAV